MTQRKVVLTSAGAVAARPQYVPSRAVVGEQNKTVLAQPVRPTERSEVGPASHAHTRTCASEQNPEGGLRAARSPARAARVHAHEPDDIDAFLAKLTREQKQEMLDRFALENVKGAGGRDLDMWSASVARALEDAIGGSGREAYGQLLCKRQLGSSSTWAPIEAFMRTSGLSDLVVVERQAVYNLLAELIVDAAKYNARRSGAPLSLRLTASHTGQVNGIFERAFPGYVAAGLAYVVAKQSLRA